MSAKKQREKNRRKKLTHLLVKCLKVLVTMPLEKRHRELYSLQSRGVDCMAGAMKEAVQGSS